MRWPKTTQNGHPVELFTPPRADQALQRWNERLGRMVLSLWTMERANLGLLVVVLLLASGYVYERFVPRPQILPFGFIWDPDGRTLWKGVPGSYQVYDAWILNHLRDWVINVRMRHEDPSLVVTAYQWGQADKLTLPQSPAKAKLAQYFHEQDPRQVKGVRPRIEVDVYLKHPLPGGEWYRLEWREKWIGPSGQVMQAPKWRADFQVVLKPPYTIEDAEKYDYGIMLKDFVWTPVGEGGS